MITLIISTLPLSLTNWLPLRLIRRQYKDAGPSFNPTNRRSGPYALCWFNVIPPSAMLAQQWPRIGSADLVFAPPELPRDPVWTSYFLPSPQSEESLLELRWDKQSVIDDSPLNSLPPNTRRWTNVVIMLSLRLRRGANIKTALVQRLLFAGSCSAKQKR